MTADRLLADLRGRGVRMWVADDQLRYSAPKGVITDEVRVELTAHKRELMDLLSASGTALSLQQVAAGHHNGDIPLSFAQERLWFLEQLVSDAPLFNMDAALPLTVPINAAVLRRTLDEIVRRHEVLRTRFPSVGGRPSQVVWPPEPVDFKLVDLQSMPREQAKIEAERLAYDEARRQFDLAAGPLLRVRLATLAPTEHVFVLTMHHIVSDGWSMQIFFDELTQLYSAYALGRPSPLAELPIQYADFAVWQRRWLTGDVLDAQLTFWREQLADLPVLQLPTDRPRPAIESYQGAHQAVSLERQLTDALKKLAVAERASLFMVLLAGFASVLSRYTAQDDVVVGTYIAGRNRAETERLIGFFINTLVLRVDLSGDPSFRQLLGRVRDTALAAYDHQDLPFPRLVEELQPSRDLSRNPLFQVVFQLFNAPGAGNDEGRAAPTTITVERGTSVFDLVVSLAEVADGLSGSFEFNTDLFDPSTITRLAGHWSTLLTSASADPDRPVSELDLLTAAESAQLLGEWNDTNRPYPLADSLIELFAAAAAAHPEDVAFSCGEDALTYAVLDRRSAAIATSLVREGVEPGVVVGLCLERSLRAVVGVLAILKAGGTYLPLDPSYPHSRLRFMLADSGASVLLTGSEFLSVFDNTGVTTCCIDRIDLDSEQPPRPTKPVVSPDDLAYVIYTSGSTGTPKGVAVPHRQVLNRLQWMWDDHPFGQDEVACQKTPLSFVDSLWELFGSLLKGVPTVLIPDDAVKDPGELVRILRTGNVSRIWLVPSLLRNLLDIYPDLQALLPSLRFWVTSGEALSSELLEQFRRAMPDATLYNLYGTSEVWDVTWYDTRQLSEVPWHVPIGRPIANMRAHVLDGDLRPVPVGVPGELCVGGVGLAAGYLGHPALTAARFVPDPLSDDPDAKLYRTGDVVRRRADGNIEYLGRQDHQVKIRGFRVELAEIEVVLRQQPGVQQAVVHVTEDVNDNRLVAYVVQDPEYHGTADEEIDWDRTQVPQWREIWDETYARKPADTTGAFNTAGFISSFSGLPVPSDEIEEWIGDPVERILALNPERVLEIGCGTGLVLLRVAPQCSAYWGTDISPNAIRLLSNTVESSPALRHVRLFERPADDFGGFDDAAFDVVALNSVIQYFPSVEYLVDVLDRVIARPGVRAVFLGDVRSLPLLPAFHTAVELARAPASMPASALRTRVHDRIAREKELVIDPAFFAALAQNFPVIDSVDISLKRGRLHNEFSSFRYDVTLGIGDPHIEPVEFVSVDCTRDAGFLDEVRALLADDTPDRFVLREVPNARVGTAVAAWRLLDDGELATVGHVRDASSNVAGVDPEDLWALADASPYDVEVTWSDAGSDGAVDAWFTRCGSSRAGRSVLAATPPRRIASWRTLANNPRQGMFTSSLVPRLRATLEGELPDHMLPSSYVLIDELPLTPSGKLDRIALASHGRDREQREVIYEAPRNALEKVVVGLFAEVLGVDDVGIRDNFFNELGGHSLLATQLVSRLREALTIEIPLRWAFEEPTAAGLATRLLDESSSRARIQRTAELIVELDTMTDDEIESMLVAKRS